MMFQVGDWVVYGREGVCQITSVGPLKMRGFENKGEYYEMRSYYRGGTIFAPVNGKIMMRPVITRAEIDELCPKLRELPILDDVPTETRLVEEYYRSLIAEQSCEKLLRLCKTIHEKQERLRKMRRTVNATDLRNWKLAEEMLFGELGFVLQIEPAQVRLYLEQFM